MMNHDGQELNIDGTASDSSRWNLAANVILVNDLERGPRLALVTPCSLGLTVGRPERWATCFS